VRADVLRGGKFLDADVVSVLGLERPEKFKGSKRAEREDVIKGSLDLLVSSGELSESDGFFEFSGVKARRPPKRKVAKSGKVRGASPKDTVDARPRKSRVVKESSGETGEVKLADLRVEGTKQPSDWNGHGVPVSVAGEVFINPDALLTRLLNEGWEWAADAVVQVLKEAGFIEVALQRIMGEATEEDGKPGARSRDVYSIVTELAAESLEAADQVKGLRSCLTSEVGSVE